MQAGKTMVTMFAMTLAVCATSWGDVMNWTNPVGGDFAVNANWDTAMPGANDEARFNLDSATGYTVTNVQDETVNQSFTVAQDNVKLDLTERTYVLTDIPALVVATSGTTGRLEVVGGKLSLDRGPGGYSERTEVRVGGHRTQTTTQHGTLILNGTTVGPRADFLDIGNWGGGSGEVILRNGTKTIGRGFENVRMKYNTNSLTVADSGTEVTVYFTNMGSGTARATESARTLNTLTVTNGATFLTGWGTTFIGRNAPGMLVVTGTGSVFSHLGFSSIGRPIEVGVEDLGRGLIVVRDGGLFRDSTTTNEENANTSFGTGGTSRGSLLVEGENSEYRVEKTASYAVNFSDNGSTLVVRDGGMVSATQGAALILESGAFLGGDGLLRISVTNAGTIKPGGTMDNDGWYDVTSGTGTLTVDDDMTLTSTSVCEMELAGTEAGSHDRITITGEATLAGTLTVRLIEGFVPQVQDSFTLLTFDDRDGSEFDTVDLPELDDGLGWSLQYSASSVILSVTPPAGTLLIVR